MEKLRDIQSGSKYLFGAFNVFSRASIESFTCKKNYFSSGILMKRSSIYK